MSERIYVVDRIEGRGAKAVAILVADDERQVEVPRAVLGKLAVEGAVLRVPLVAKAPEWTRATRDREEERRRTDEAAETLKRLTAGDAGGDLEL